MPINDGRVREPDYLKSLKSAAWHIITSEYPPQSGGVSDYTHLVAAGLAGAGDEVHVWCPAITNDGTNPNENELRDSPGVFVHRECGHFKAADLRRVGNLLDQFIAPKRLLVQWVPHGFGYRSMNLPFCIWLWSRSIRRRDVIEIMVHEPYLSFGGGSLKQSGVAALHRLMTVFLLNAAHRVWVSIPAWEQRLRPYALGRALRFDWLPVVSNIAVVDDPAGVKAIRAHYLSSEGLANRQIVGHFGSYDRNVTALLLESLPSLLRNRADRVVLLLGRGSEQMRDELIRAQPDLERRVNATGSLDTSDLSRHISACDVLVQPYVDGVSTRRTSVMVGLSHGVPIVTTKGRLTEALWTESEAAAFVSAGDMAGLVNSAERLLGNSICRLRMRTSARALYEERFDVSRAIASLREAF